MRYINRQTIAQQHDMDIVAGTATLPKMRYKGACVHPQRVRRPQGRQQPLLQEVDDGASVPLRVAKCAPTV